MSLISIAYPVALVACKVAVAWNLKSIYQSSKYNYDNFMAIVISLALLELAFFHYVYNLRSELEGATNSSLPTGSSSPQDLPEEVEEPGHCDCCYLSQPLPEIEPKHCDCCFLTMLKPISGKIESQDPDTSSTWAIASEVSYLDLGEPSMPDYDWFPLNSHARKNPIIYEIPFEGEPEYGVWMRLM